MLVHFPHFGDCVVNLDHILLMVPRVKVVPATDTAPETRTFFIGFDFPNNGAFAVEFPNEESMRASYSELVSRREISVLHQSQFLKEFLERDNAKPSEAVERLADVTPVPAPALSDDCPL